MDMLIDPLHKWRLYLNNNTYTSLASHSWEKSFVLKHEYEAKDVQSIVIQIYTPFMQGLYKCDGTQWDFILPRKDLHLARSVELHAKLLRWHFPDPANKRRCEEHMQTN